MPATRTATASARCTSTPWRVSGHCSAPGCVRIAASRRRSCQSISASLSSCTTRAGAEKPCSVPLSLLWSGDALHHPGSRQEPAWFGTYGGKSIAVFDKNGKPLTPPEGLTFNGKLGLMQGIIVAPNGDVWSLGITKNQLLHFPKGDLTQGRIVCEGREVEP